MSAMFDQNVKLETVKEVEKQPHDETIQIVGGQQSKRQSIPLAIETFEHEPMSLLYNKTKTDGRPSQDESNTQFFDRRKAYSSANTMRPLPKMMFEVDGVTPKDFVDIQVPTSNFESHHKRNGSMVNVQGLINRA